MKSLLFGCALFPLMGAQVHGDTEQILILKTKTGDITGTLLVPESKSPVPIALIIAGSGPTDGDGNNAAMKTNSLKLLAAGLAEHEIATLRYDKRGVGKSKAAGLKESDLRFGNYIGDAGDWIELLKKTPGLGTLTVIGHSEGAQIGLVAAQSKSVDRFISIAGPGQSADKVIREQLRAQPPMVMEKAGPILDALVKGKTVDSVPPMLNALFRPSVQPYLISWFQCDPQAEIRKVDKPILIVQGTTDIQVGVEDAKRLHEANPKSKMLLLEGMNHIFKDAPADRKLNIATYNSPETPIRKDLIDGIAEFIHE